MTRAKMKWHGRKATKAARRGAVRGLDDAVEWLLGEAVDIVPIEEGTLARSGTADVDEGQLRGAVSFDTPYAVRQHEDLNLRHDTGRQAKYLETPMNTGRRTIRDLIGSQIRREVD